MGGFRLRAALAGRHVLPMFWSGLVGWVLVSALITAWGMWLGELRLEDFFLTGVKLMPVVVLAHFAGWSLMIRFRMVNAAGFVANAVALGAALAALQGGASALGLRLMSVADAFVLGVLIWLSMWIVFSIAYLLGRSADGEEDAAA